MDISHYKYDPSIDKPDITCYIIIRCNSGYSQIQIPDNIPDSRIKIYRYNFENNKDIILENKYAY